MTIRTSKFIDCTLATISGDSAGDVVVNDYFYDIPANQIILNDIIDIGTLPAGHVVTNMQLIVDDLDSNGTPTVKLDVGLVSGTPGDTVNARTCGAEFFAADTTAQAGGVAKMTLKSGFLVKAVDVDRSIGVKIQTAAATAAAGRIRLRVEMHPSDQNIQF